MRRAAFLIVAIGRARAAGRAPRPRRCRPTAAHPYPVILVHGTFANQALSWNALRPLLEADGFCVFSLDYGNQRDRRRWRSPATSRRRLRAAGPARRPARPRCPSSATRRAGSLSRYVAKAEGCWRQTDDIVGLAPSSHGTTSPFAGPAALLGCAACARPGRRARRSCRRSTRRPRRRARSSYTVGLDALRRGRHALPVAGAGGRHGDQRRPAGPLPRRPHRARRHHLRPRRAAVGHDALLRPAPADPAFVPDCSGDTTGTRPLAARRRSRRGDRAAPASCAAPRCAWAPTGASRSRCAAWPPPAGHAAGCSSCAPAAAWPPSAPSPSRRDAPRGWPLHLGPAPAGRAPSASARRTRSRAPTRCAAPSAQECGLPHPDARRHRATLDARLPLSSFTPAVRDWFERSFEAPTPAQEQAWPAIATGEHVLISAPTGSGKTLAAFLWGLDRLSREPAGAHAPGLRLAAEGAGLRRRPQPARAAARASAPTSRWRSAPATRPSASAPRCAARRPTSSSRRPSRCT